MGSAVSTLPSRYASCPLFHMLFSKRLIGGPGSFFTVPVYRSGGLTLGVREKSAPPEDRYRTGDLPAVAARVYTDSHGSRNSRRQRMRQMSEHGRAAAIRHPQSRGHTGRNLFQFDARPVRLAGLPAPQLARFLEVFRQPEHILLRHLRDHFPGFAVDHPNHIPVGFRILLETQLVLRPEHFRTVDRLDRLNHFSLFRRLVDGHRRRWRMDTRYATADCG